jgi:tetratricopeptide (TPR) repeat protein
MSKLILGLFLVLASSLASSGDWKLLKAPQFTVLSELSDGETLNWAQQYDQFIAATSGLLQLDPRALPPLTIVLFKNHKNFAPYRIAREDGRAANVAGQFLRRSTFALAAVADQFEDAWTRQTIFHEGTHWLFSGERVRHPPWFNEGMAELFGTFERRLSKVSWAKPVVGHLQNLNYQRMLPLREFLSAQRALFNNDNHTGLFYSQAWAFSHFMLLEDNGRWRPKLIEYLETYRTASVDDTIKKVFGADFPKLEKDFARYVDGGRRYQFMEQPVVARPALPAPVSAPAGLADAVLGLWALNINNEDLARKHSVAALEAGPQEPRAHELKAYIADLDSHRPDLIAHADSAIRLGSKDAQMHVLLAQVASTPRQRASHLESAINLSPRLSFLYHMLADALQASGSPSDEDEKFMAVGLAALPQDDAVRVSAARVLHQRGNLVRAINLMDQALQAGSSLDGPERNNAQAVRRMWHANELQEKFNIAVRDKRFSDARKLLADFTPRLQGDPALEHELLDQASNLDVMEALHKAFQTLEAGRKQEARQMLDELLQRPNLPTTMRLQVEQARRTIAR